MKFHKNRSNVVASSYADIQADTMRVLVVIRSANTTKKARKPLVPLWPHDILHTSVYLVITKGYKYRKVLQDMMVLTVCHSLYDRTARKENVTHSSQNSVYRNSEAAGKSPCYRARINTNFSWRDRNVGLQPATVIELVDRPSGPWEGGTAEGNIKKRRKVWKGGGIFFLRNWPWVLTV